MVTYQLVIYKFILALGRRLSRAGKDQKESAEDNMVNMNSH